MKPATKQAIFLGGLAILMAVPMVLYFQLHVGTWDIWYLNAIPLWAIFGLTVLLVKRPKLVNVARWVVAWYLSYWLLYDFTWWGITAALAPGTIAWTTPFYFDIIVPQPRMWFFLLVSIAGFALSVAAIATKQATWTKLAPFIMYLFYVYGLGGYTQYFGQVADSIYMAWSLVLIPAIIILFLHARRII